MPGHSTHLAENILLPHLHDVVVRPSFAHQEYFLMVNVVKLQISRKLVLLRKLAKNNATHIANSSVSIKQQYDNCHPCKFKKGDRKLILGMAIFFHSGIFGMKDELIDNT